MQHRSQREGGARELSRLRQEVDSLRRQVARLRRENERLRQTPPDEPPPEPKPAKKVCPECGTKPVEFTTPRGKKISRCPGCGLNLGR